MIKIESSVSNKKAISFLWLVVLFFLVIICDGQELPKVIQPSPEASALFRFQDYPMDYSTGLPSISIPIYTVQSGSLSVPISISNHASGRRVTDQDGAVALGWSLDAGGMISRTIYGSADFGTPTNGTYSFPYPFRTTGLTNFDDYRYFEKITHFNNPDAFILPWTESEYDVFSYNFGGNGGKFIFKDNNGVKSAVLLPFKPYIVTPIYTSRGIGEIDITDDKGVFYRFGAAEQSGPDGDYAVTSLSLIQIISADKVDTINFIYTGFAQWNSNSSQVRTYKMDWSPNPGGLQQNGDQITTESPSTGTYQINRLTEIDFKQGKVLFNLVAGSDKLDNIQVKDNSNSLIKTIQFNRSLLDRLKAGGSSQNPNISQVNNKLDSLLFKDNTGAVIEKYAFEYYPTKYVNSETSVDTHYSDWWGFYNASGFINMIPHYDLASKDIPGLNSIGGFDFNREPDLEAAKSGMMKKITYPTGGSSEFTFENNKYSDVPGNQKNGPGLRVSQVITRDNNSGSITKTYKYGINESGDGFLELRPDVNTMADETDYRYWYGAGGSPPDPAGTHNLCTFFSGFTPSLSALAGRPVIYTQVAEYIGTPGNNLGKTVYEYDNYAWAPAGMPAYGPQIIQKKQVSNFNYWNNPSLLFKTDYKNTSLPGSLPSYSVRKKVSNTYNITNIDDVVGLHVQRLEMIPQTGVVGNNASYYVEQYFITVPECQCVPEKVFTFSEYHIPVGIKTLASTTETLYNDDGSMVTSTTTNAYNSKYYLSQKIQNTSDNGTITQNITYPFDYTGNVVLTQMLTPSVNMLNFPIEQSDMKNAVPVKSVRTNYFNWGSVNAMIKPQTIDVRKGTNAYETRLRFYGYDDRGNPLSVAKENGINMSYIWGYNKTYPIAQATNAKSNEIFFDGLEEPDGWQNLVPSVWPNVIYDNSKSHSGKYSGKIINPNSYEVYYHSAKWLQIQLGAPTKFKYSGWFYSDGPQVEILLFMKRAGETGYFSYVDVTPMNTTGKWTYVEKEYTVPTDVVQLNIRVDNNSTGTIWFDDIRLHPSAAQLTTYTYDPLIGMTSQCNANNRVTYYEYDNYGRLKLVKDADGNILKTMSYQYKSTTP